LLGKKENCNMMPFQNRTENIKKIAETLYKNRIAIETNQRSMVNCITLCQCMGIGKTRITTDFLEILRSPGYKDKIQNEIMKFFDDSILIYINFEEFRIPFINDRSFFKSFWIYILGQILDMLDISFSDEKLYNWVLKSITSVQEFLKILKNLFISQSNSFLKHIKPDQPNENEIINNLQRIQDFVQNRTKTGKCDYIIFGFDEVATLAERGFFSEAEKKNIDLLLIKPNDDEYSQKIALYYYLWREHFSLLQTKHTDIILAGRNSYIPFIGKSLNQGFLQKASPSPILHISLNCFVQDDIHNIFNDLILKHGEEKGFKEMKHFLQVNDKEDKYFNEMISLIYEYSAGLPRLVDLIKWFFLIKLKKNQLAQHFENQRNFFESHVNDNDIINQNPFQMQIENRQKKDALFNLLLLGVQKEKIHKGKKAQEIDPVFSKFCPDGFTIEDGLLHFGIPYSTENDSLTIEVPTYFQNGFLNSLEGKQKKFYKFVLAKLHSNNISLDHWAIFEIMMAFKFFQIFKASNGNLKQYFEFIEETIDDNHFNEKLDIIFYESIKAHDGAISTNLNAYCLFNSPTVIVPDEKSYGPDFQSYFTLKGIPHSTQNFINISGQMKDYFSGATKLSIAEIEKEVNKMQNIINHLDQKFKKFYYIIICPSYEQDVLDQFFPGNQPSGSDPLKIMKDDFIYQMKISVWLLFCYIQNVSKD